MTWCLLLTGLPNSGKSTLAYHLVQEVVRNVLIIDGDKHREMQFLGKELGFEKEDILANNEHVIKMAKFAQDQGINVIISQIAPYFEQRKAMRDQLEGFFEVFCNCSKKGRSLRPNYKNSDIIYEEGGHDMVVNTETHDIDICIQRIRDYWFDGVKK